MADPLFATLQSKFGGAVEPGSGFRGEETVIVRKAQILDVCTLLRDDPALRFDSMRDLCGADYYRPDDRFEVIYNLYSIPNKRRLRLKVRIDEADMHVASVSGIWSTADWLERETYDMYGIIFDGHPDLRRIFMPEEFEYHPLRKDFPLMGIPGSLPLPHQQS
jgi:NADH-quinone oxidoreductase subunit C